MLSSTLRPDESPPLNRKDYALATAFGVASLIAMGLLVRAARPCYLGFTDSTPYIIQTHLFLQGHLTGTAPPKALMAFFDTNGMIDLDGRWFSRQPPGASALFTLPTWVLGDIRLAPPVLSALALAITYVWVRRAYDRRIAVTASLLIMISPYVMGLRCSVFSYVPSLLLCSAAMLAFTYTLSRPGILWAVLLGLFVGFEATVRPYTAVLVTLGLVGSRALIFRQRPIGLNQVLALIAGASIGVALLLIHNRIVTHGWWPLAFNLYDPKDRLGFGLRGLAQRTVYLTPGLAAKNLLLTLFGTGLTFFCYFAWLIPPFVWWMGRIAARARSTNGKMVPWDWSLLLVVGAVILGHGAYWWPRNTNFLEVFPLLAVFISRGLWTMACGGRGLRSLLYLVTLPLMIAAPARMMEGWFRAPDTPGREILRAIERKRIEVGNMLIFTGLGDKKIGDFGADLAVPGLFNTSVSADEAVLYAIDRGDENDRLTTCYPNHRPYILTTAPKYPHRPGSPLKPVLTPCGDRSHAE